jgi:hypothetical protein
VLKSAFIRRETPNKGEENWRGEIVDHARQVASYSEPGSDLVGFMVIGLFSDGSHAAGFRWDGDKSPIPRRLMPAYVAEIVREDLVTNTTIADALE